jgi:hypothetical protein
MTAYQVVRGDRRRLALGQAVAPPKGARLPRPEVPGPCHKATRSSGRGADGPGVVPGGLRHADRAASSWRDPPGRC